MKKLARSAMMLLILLVPISSWARGGGGCLEEGTRIHTPKGVIAIESLKRGDPVWSIKEGKLERAQVRTLTMVHPEEYLEFFAAGTRLAVTHEHPVMVAPGEYRLAGLIQVDDTVYLERNGKLNPSRVQSVRRIVAKRPAYNLLVSPGGTFITERFVVHNKGCFLPDSQILKADGTESPISAVLSGDELLAFTSEGRMVRARVREVLRHEVEDYILLKTDRALLRVTAEHPFYVGCGTFKTVEALKEGDTVFAQIDLSVHEGGLVRETVQAAQLQVDGGAHQVDQAVDKENEGGEDAQDFRHEIFLY